MIPVLCYHRIGFQTPGADHKMNVDPVQFRTQMEHVAPPQTPPGPSRCDPQPQREGERQRTAVIGSEERQSQHQQGTQCVFTAQR